jgi:hypothetical protein
MRVRLVQTSLGMKIKPTSDMGSPFSTSSTASLPGPTDPTTQTTIDPRHVLVYNLGDCYAAEIVDRWMGVLREWDIIIPTRRNGLTVLDWVGSTVQDADVFWFGSIWCFLFSSASGSC